jgi:hypothetical protein
MWFLGRKALTSQVTMAQPPVKSTDRGERDKRLAEALRQNLRRRKAQAREREEAVDPPPKPESPSMVERPPQRS